MVNKIISVVLMLIVEAVCLLGFGLLGSIALNKLGIPIGIIDCSLSLFGLMFIGCLNVEVIRKFMKK